MHQTHRTDGGQRGERDRLVEQGGHGEAELPGASPGEVVLEADPAAAPIGLLELSASQVAIRVSRDAGSSRLVRELDCQGSGCHTSVAPADPDDAAGLVGSQLARGGKNTLFRKVFPRFLELLGD
ncbi:MAG TPA: hypothetical protein VIM44_02175, partial [Rariglobus sp.]